MALPRKSLPLLPGNHCAHKFPSLSSSAYSRTSYKWAHSVYKWAHSVYTILWVVASTQSKVKKRGIFTSCSPLEPQCLAYSKCTRNVSGWENDGIEWMNEIAPCSRRLALPSALPSPASLWPASSSVCWSTTVVTPRRPLFGVQSTTLLSVSVQGAVVPNGRDPSPTSCFPAPCPVSSSRENMCYQAHVNPCFLLSHNISFNFQPHFHPPLLFSR